MSDETIADSTGHFLSSAEISDAARAIFDEDIAEVGFVMNASRLWAHQPEAGAGLFSLMTQVTSGRPFTLRECGILVTASASALGDSYCSLAWGTKLARKASPELAAGVLRGDDVGLTAQERAMAEWARLVVRNPGASTAQDVQSLRDAGFSEEDILAMTLYIGLRVALATVHDALGACPDAEFKTAAPPEVLNAVTYGRPMAAGPTAS
jgi:alkylhydroperoxidase family enzyme